MNLDEYKGDARALMKFIDQHTKWSTFVQLGKVRKDYTVFKVMLDTDNDDTQFQHIKPFFINNGCKIIERKGNRITIIVKTTDINKLLALYKLYEIK